MSYLDARDLLGDRDELRDEDPNWVQLNPDQAARLARLEEFFEEEGEGWVDDEPTMVPTDEFQDYAEDYARDCGDMPRDVGWPLTHIDWEAAADELAEGWEECEFEDVTYYRRSN